MNKLLSIVIPVYKVEKFIDKCISSLIVPDEKQLELLDIVVINDGTPFFCHFGIFYPFYPPFLSSLQLRSNLYKTFG